MAHSSSSYHHKFINLQTGMSVHWEMVAASKSVLTVQAPTVVSATMDIYCRQLARTVRL